MDLKYVMPNKIDRSDEDRQSLELHASEIEKCEKNGYVFK